MTCGIYGIVDSESGRTYVGSSKNIERRFIEHKHALRKNKHSNKYLQNIYNKNPDRLSYYILEEIEKDKLREVEQVYIDLMFAIKIQLNVSKDANCPPLERTQEHINKVASANRGRKHSDETKRKLRDSALKRPKRKLSEEHKKKLSEINSGKKLSEECKQKLSEAHKGKKLSEEHKQKIRDAHSGMKNKQHSEETKKKISQSKRGKPNNKKGIMHSEESKKKMSESAKLIWSKKNGSE